MWVGGEFGLALFHGDRFHTVRGTGSSGFGSVSGIVAVPSGVWLSTSSGIVYIPEREIHRVSSDPAYRVTYEVLDQLSDLPGPLPIRTSGEPAVEGSDGVLWFVTTNGVARVDPRRVTRNPLPPPVVIRSVIADDTPYSPHELPVALPALTRTIRIDYSGLSLRDPRASRFRYRLEGWNLSGTMPAHRRTAFSQLGSGQSVVSRRREQQRRRLERPARPLRSPWRRHGSKRCGSMFAMRSGAHLPPLCRIRVRRRRRPRCAIRRAAGRAHSHRARTARHVVADGASQQNDGRRRADAAPDPERMRRVVQKLSEWLGQAVREGGQRSTRYARQPWR